MRCNMSTLALSKTKPQYALFKEYIEMMWCMVGNAEMKLLTVCLSNIIDTSCACQVGHFLDFLVTLVELSLNATETFSMC